MLSYDQNLYYLKRLSIGLPDKDKSFWRKSDRGDELTAPTISSDVADLKATMAEMMSSFKTEIFTHTNDSISQVYHNFEQAVCYLQRDRNIVLKTNSDNLMMR